VTTPSTASTAAARQALGAYGEMVAARLLQERGMVVLDRNWRCEVGEIDLVLRDGPVLVVCEVKTRRSLACGTPHEAVTPEKVARLVRLGARWQEAHGVAAEDVRIDMVCILRPRRGPAVVDHVQGVV
jgi:putative endonuclease